MQVAKHIFTSPSSALKAGISNGTCTCNAKLHGMTRVEAEHIVYATVIMIHMLLTMHSQNLFHLPEQMHWQMMKGLWDVRLEHHQFNSRVLLPKMKQWSSKWVQSIQFGTFDCIAINHRVQGIFTCSMINNQAKLVGVWLWYSVHWDTIHSWVNFGTKNFWYMPWAYLLTYLVFNEYKLVIGLWACVQRVVIDRWIRIIRGIGPRPETVM